MRHGSLFSGIGGFDLAASWMGWENMFHCEWNQFGQQVLKYHFPNSVSYDDICKTDFTLWRGKVDIITGGFPCQPFSHAGKRSGTDDNRYLWPQMRRAIRESQPSVFVAENVAGLFSILEPESLSEVENKEIQLFCKDEEYPVTKVIERIQRRVIATIIQEIRSDGYVLPELADGTPIVCCIPACAVNAPHRRDRVWIVARRITTNSRLPGQKVGQIDTMGIEQLRQERTSQNPNEDGRGGDERVDAYHNYTRLEGCEVIGETGRERQESYQFASGLLRTDWTDFPTQSPICGGNDGFSPDMDNATFFKQLGIDNPRQPAISYAKWRNESIKAYGNAIVPQVAFQIFKVIDEMNKP